MWVAVLSCVLLCCLEVRGADYFDCRRQGQNCENNMTCNMKNGTCQCSDVFVGSGCEIKKTLIGAAPCENSTDSCGSEGGQCYNNGGSKACLCPVQFYGDHCAKKRFDVECLELSMKIKLYPAGTFNGVVYVPGARATARCSVTPTGNSTTPFDITVDDPACGAVSGLAGGARSRSIIVQYTTKYITGVDSILNITCSGGTSSIEVKTAFNSGTLEESAKEQIVNSTLDVGSPVFDFVVKLKDGSPVTSSVAVPITEELTFQFSGDIIKGYSEFPLQGGDTYLKSDQKEDTNLTSCRYICENTTSCLSFNLCSGVGDICTIYTAPAIRVPLSYNHYEKDCSAGTCTYVQFKDKTSSEYYGSFTAIKTTDLEKCKSVCSSASDCRSFSTIVLGAKVLCFLYEESLLDLDKVRTYTCSYFEKQSSALRVDSCTASNGKLGKDTETLKLIENGCRSSDVGKLMTADPTYDKTMQASFQIRAFMFSKSNAVTVTCQVKYCHPGYADECQQSCGSSQNRRRRRSAETSEETVRKTFYILNTQHKTIKSAGSSSVPLASKSELTTTVVAGVALVIMLLLGICIVVLVVRKRRSDGKSESKSLPKEINTRA